MQKNENCFIQTQQHPDGNNTEYVLNKLRYAKDNNI